MKLYAFNFFSLILCLFLTRLEALHRDYEDPYQYCYNPYCLDHVPDNFTDEIPYYLLALIPQTETQCIRCDELSIYLGYLDLDFKKYLSHLKQQLEYTISTNCGCLWPEYSTRAAQISNSAYLLFYNLVSTTALSNLIENEIDQREFIENPCWFLNQHGLTISFIAQQFRFSDYYRVCRDIEDHAISKYQEEESEEIKDKLQDILEILYPRFFKLYSICYRTHPNPEIDQEICFMKFLASDISGLEKTLLFSNSKCNLQLESNFNDSSEFINAKLQAVNIPIELKSKGIFSLNPMLNIDYFDSIVDLKIADSSDDHPSNIITFSPQSDIFLEQGSLLNDLFLYNEAIQVLTQAIQLKPSNRDAYIERAMAYFETNQLTLALKDYESAKKLTIIPPFKPACHKAISSTIYIPENKTEFSKGLVSGTLDGAKASSVEFIPSIFNCCRGILNGLWAFTCSPTEVSQEMIRSSYAIGEFIGNHSTKECLQCVVPELKELSLYWNKLSDHSRGQKIGFIIGKYGVDIFAPIGTLKGLSKVRTLKRANTMCTLESCASSQAKQATIIAEGNKIVALSEGVIAKSIEKGNIFIKSSNVQYHVMQPKHGWDKILKLSGNVEEDFKKVTYLLEKESIFSKDCFLRSREFAQGKIIRSDYQKIINDHKIQAVFETYKETNQIFLQDAWVITK